MILLHYWVDWEPSASPGFSDTTVHLGEPPLDQQPISCQRWLAADHFPQWQKYQQEVRFSTGISFDSITETLMASIPDALSLIS